MFLKVKVFTRSKKSELREISPDKFEIYTKSSAQRNLANKEVRELVADFFQIPMKNVRIISGHHRPNKMLEIKKIS